MRPLRAAALLALPLSALMVLSACGGGGPADDGGGGTTISVYGSEPENPLVPGDTNEVGGGKIVDAMWDGLVQYAPDGQVSNLAAQSIDTTDSRTFTIRIMPGRTFHDGSPVTAASFVDAWNYTAFAPNGQASASFFANVQGYDAVNPDSGPPTAQTMAGLRVVDDTTFTVTLNAPSAVFPTTLGYSVFYPMPRSFFANPEAFAQNPIGNGAFRYVSRQPNQNVTLARYAEYAGPTRPSIDGVQFRFYTDSQAAYQDVVSGNLDFINEVPSAFLVDNLYQTDLPDRNGSQIYSGITSMAFPFYDPRYQNPQVRQAISMAIDRPAIAQSAYNGLVTPADGFVGTGVPGRAENQCGQNCTFQPERARQMLQQAGFTGPIQLVSNADNAINAAWMQGACVSITNATGIACNFAPVPTFAEFLTQRDERAVPGIFRTGWVADYPSIENFLNPIYRTGGSANDGDYTSPEFDAAMTRADGARSLPEAERLYQEAERILARDMPGIPMFNPSAQFGWSERLQNAGLDYRRELDLDTVTVADQ